MRKPDGTELRTFLLRLMLLGAGCGLAGACTSVGPVAGPGLSAQIQTNTAQTNPAQTGPVQMAQADSASGPESQAQAQADGAPMQIAALSYGASSDGETGEGDSLRGAVSAADNGGGGGRPVGAAYQIAGKWYQPAEDPDYSEVGLASWYGEKFHGRLTSNGETFDRRSISAAHPTLPLPSYVRVTNLENDRSIVVRVNDRGPFLGNRLIDVSERTAHILGFRRNGLAEVQVDYVGAAEAGGDDQDFLLASYHSPDGTAPAANDIMLASAGAPKPSARPGLGLGRIAKSIRGIGGALSGSSEPEPAPMVIPASFTVRDRGPQAPAASEAAAPVTKAPETAASADDRIAGAFGFANIAY